MKGFTVLAAIVGVLLLAIAIANYAPTLSRGAVNPLEFETGSAYIQLVWNTHNFTLIPQGCGYAYYSHGRVPIGPPPGALVVRIATPDGFVECAAWPRRAPPPAG